MKIRRPLGLYVHIPFCKSKCVYCDFYSLPRSEDRMDAYTDALCAHLTETAPFAAAYAVDTVYFGGGTPSYLGEKRLGRILKTIEKRYQVERDAEITFEANPDSTGDWKALRALRRAGFNRISLGMQSACDEELKAIGRIHTMEQVQQAVEAARKAKLKNLSLDLIYGLPRQTQERWMENLSAAVALNPEHLSCYSLILEEGTPLYRQAEDGTCAPLPDEDALCEMDDCTEEMTRQAGYARYEVSNYAKAGKECRHNIVYWECLPYLGIGCAAHSDMDVDGRRFYNPEDWEGYLHAVGQKERTAEGGGSREERMFERVMMGLRMIRGMDERRFERDFHMRPEEVWKKTIPQMKEKKLMESGNGRLYLTRRGMQVMNAVLVEMLEETEG